MNIAEFLNSKTGIAATVAKTARGFDVVATDTDSGLTIEVRRGFRDEATALYYAKRFTV